MAGIGIGLILRNKANIETSLGALGVPKERADQIADALSQSGGGSASGSFGEATGRAARRAFEAVQHDFALSTRTVFYVMAGRRRVATARFRARPRYSSRASDRGGVR